MAISKFRRTVAQLGALAGWGCWLMFAVPATLGQSPLPDLVVASARVNPAGAFAGSLTITIANRGEGSAGSSYVMATFQQTTGSEAKPTYFVGQALKPLAAGKTIVQIFDLTGKQIGTTTFVTIEVDPYHRVRESVEENNQLILKPR